MKIKEVTAAANSNRGPPCGSGEWKGGGVGEGMLEPNPIKEVFLW